MGMFYLPKASFIMGTFSDPQHTHPGIFILKSPPPPPGKGFHHSVSNLIPKPIHSGPHSIEPTFIIPKWTKNLPHIPIGKRTKEDMLCFDFPFTFFSCGPRTAD